MIGFHKVSEDCFQIVFPDSGRTYYCTLDEAAVFKGCLDDEKYLEFIAESLIEHPKILPGLRAIFFDLGLTVLSDGGDTPPSKAKIIC